MERLIKTLHHSSSRVLVLVDEHTLGTENLSNRLSSIRSVLNDLGVQGDVILVSKSIESWILAGLCERSAESTPDPLGRLRERLGRIVVKNYSTYYSLGKSIDVGHALANSTGFRKFLEALGYVKTQQDHK